MGQHAPNWLGEMGQSPSREQVGAASGRESIAMHAPPASAQSLKPRTMFGHWSVHCPPLQQGRPYSGQLVPHFAPGAVAGVFAVAAW
jgi:hypothetical protein